MKFFTYNFNYHNISFLLHHPKCSYYSHHIIKINEFKICRGCFITLSSIFIHSILFWQLPNDLLILDLPSLIIISIIIFIPFLLKSLIQSSTLKYPISSINNLFLGIGFSYWMRIIYFLPLSLKLLSIISSFPIFLTLYFKRTNDYWSDCKNCPEKSNRIIFNQCSGINPKNKSDRLIFEFTTL